MIDQAEVPNAEASISKVWWSELFQRVASVGLDLMGAQGQLGVGTADVPLGGNF
jgi:hypothetical protein